MPDQNALSLPDLFDELTANGCLRDLVDAMFCEDLARAGDITTASIVDPQARASAVIVARDAGIIGGTRALPRIIDERDEPVAVDVLIDDGQPCRAGSVVARMSGNLAHILMVERMVLNLLGRLSGIATLTRQFVDAIADTRAVICDTRKTTPGLRNLEKYAVRCGGGTLHRLGLFDAALYKDNHLAGIPMDQLAVRLGEAIHTVREEHDVRFVEVEVDSLEQLREILGMPPDAVDIILLDNMSPEVLKHAVRMRNESRPGLLLEASGGVNLQTVRAIAECGVDRISVGAITHSAPCLDVGLDIE